jgi:hypothetical protein
MVGGEIEGRRHLPLRPPLAHETAIAARPERQRQRVEQNGFAGSGLAGQDRQSVAEIEIEPIDDDECAGSPIKNTGRVASGRRSAPAPAAVSCCRSRRA